MKFKLRKGPDGRLWLWWGGYGETCYLADGLWHQADEDEVPQNISTFPIVDCTDKLLSEDDQIALERGKSITDRDTVALELGRAIMDSMANRPEYKAMVTKRSQLNYKVGAAEKKAREFLAKK